MTNIFVDGLLLTTSETSLLAQDAKRSYNQSVIRIALAAVLRSMGFIAEDYTYTPLNGSNAGSLVMADGKIYRVSAMDTQESTIDAKRLLLTGELPESIIKETPKHFDNCLACSSHPSDDYDEDIVMGMVHN